MLIIPIRFGKEIRDTYIILRALRTKCESVIQIVCVGGGGVNVRGGGICPGGKCTDAVMPSCVVNSYSLIPNRGRLVLMYCRNFKRPLYKTNDSSTLKCFPGSKTVLHR